MKSNGLSVSSAAAEQLPRRNVPWLVIAALLAAVAALSWLAHFGFPREWGDVLFFKQPAYMALHTGRFTLPTAIGYRPYVDVVYAAYPPVYTYASLAVFKLFGFGVHASLGFDLAVHFLLAGLLGWILWQKTGNQVVAALFVLLSTGFLLPEGRPDELAALLALLAIMATARRRYLLTALLLGLSLATQPTQAILGAFLCFSVDFAAHGPGWRLLVRAAGIGAAAAIISGLVWLPAVAAHLPEAIAQFRAHSSDRWTLDLIELLTRERLWAGFWVFAVGFVAAGGLFVLRHPPAVLRRDPEAVTFLAGVLFSLPLCIGFLLYLGSPLYGYRLLNFLYLAVALYLIYALAVSATRAGTAASVAATAAIVLLGGILNYDMARFILAPLTWGEGAVTYEQAIATVRTVVPPDATVGGDSIAWWAIDDGRPFYSLSWYAGEPWPDYILSTTFWGKGGLPTVLQQRVWADRIEAEYVEVTPPRPPAEPCAFHIFNRSLPLSRSGGSCDWHVRIWKRR